MGPHMKQRMTEWTAKISLSQLSFLTHLHALKSFKQDVQHSWFHKNTSAIWKWREQQADNPVRMES